MTELFFLLNMNSIMADEGHDIRPPHARRPRVRRALVGRNTYVRFILTDRTDFEVTSTALVGEHPVLDVPLVDDGGLGWEDVSFICPVQTILDLYTIPNDPQMIFSSRGPLVSRLDHAVLRDSIRYHWARLHHGAVVSRPGMFFVQQCYVHSVLGRRVDFRSVPTTGHGAHMQSRNLSRIALGGIDLEAGEGSSAPGPSSTHRVVSGSHVVLSSDDVTALAGRVQDLIETYRREFDSTSDQVHLASCRASLSQSTLDDARTQLRSMEERATQERTLAMRRIRALEIQTHGDQAHLCHLVGRQIRLEITMHTLQHAPIDCSSSTWSSRLDESEEGIGLCVVPSLVRETFVEGQLPEGFDISMRHRDVFPFFSRSFDTLGFYALGCAHIFHFHCLIQMVIL